MSAIPNSLQRPEDFDVQVRKFRLICIMHGLPIGSRADLPGFVQKLMDDRHLAMDFWAFVGKLSNREGGEFSDEAMLAVVTEGVTGYESLADDGELKQAVDNLRAMLAGVDIQAAEQSQPAPSSTSETVALEDDRESRIHAVESPTIPSNPPVSFPSETADKKEGLPPPSSTTPPLQLDEAVLRLELARLVKQYFESIDEHKIKSEPNPEKATVEQASPVGTFARATQQSLERQDTEDTALLDEPTLTHTNKSRIVLEPPEPRIDDFVATDDRPIQVPLAGYSEPAGYGKAILFLVLASALFGGGFAAYRYRAPLLKQMSVLGQDIRQKTGASQSAPLPSVPEVTASAQQAQPSQPPVQPPVLQGISTPSTPEGRVANIPPPPTTPAAEINPNNNRKVIADRVVPPEPPPPPDGISSAELAGAVQVAPAAMEANLVASRVPAYPESAKIDRIEGSVLMQIIISQEGTVKRVHVLQGDSRLRSAAAAAVYKWRYRPYLLNGQPVNVATTVKVDFSLDR